MKKDKKDATFRFGVVEENGRDVTIEITAEDYQKQSDAGVPDNELLPAGFHKARRGGFLERHPNFNLENAEIKVIEDDNENRFSAENGKDKKAA